MFSYRPSKNLKVAVILLLRDRRIYLVAYSIWVKSNIYTHIQTTELSTQPHVASSFAYFSILV